MIIDDFKLDGKVALVTGASRGLGQAMAVALGQAGADVVGVGISNSAATAAAVEAAGGNYLAIEADLGDPGCVDVVLQQLLPPDRAPLQRVARSEQAGADQPDEQ